jgi:hypothetical protein
MSFECRTSRGDEMNSFREQTRAVNAVLLEHWDPIGVRAMDGPDSEYINYVPQLIGLALRDAPDLELAEFLGDVESGAMGLSISPLAKRLDVASRIKKEIPPGSDARDG